MNQPPADPNPAKPSGPRASTPASTPSQLSRRRFLLRSGLLGAAGLTLPQFLAACGGSSSSGTASTGGSTGTTGASATTSASSGTQSATTASGGGSGFFFDNWPAYIDPTEDGKQGTVDRFIAETKIEMTYGEGYNDNNEYFAKIQPLLGGGKTIPADMIAPTFWLTARLIGLGWVDPIPFDQIPNAANLRDDLQNASWDPKGEYSLPWQTGMTGIAYNLKATGRELNSVDDLFDPALKGKIGMLTEMRDTIGLLLLGKGIDPTTVKTFDEAAPAFEQLQQATSDGQIRQFTGNDYLDDLGNGNFAACVGWSGDVLQLTKDNPDVRFVIPEQGGIRWADTMVLPKGTPHAAEAAKFMNFVYDPVQAAQITEYVQYISPVKGVQDELAKLDPELATNPLLFPDDETSARLHSFATLDDATEQQMDEEFASITGA